MFRITAKFLAARKLRLLTTSIAVLLGVAFMAGTLVLTDTLNSTFDGLVADANRGTNAFVRGEEAFSNDTLGDQRARLDVALVDTIAGVDGVAVAEPNIQAYARIVDKEGTPVGDPGMGAPTMGAIWLASAELNPFVLAEGRPPAGDDEIVMDKASADKTGYRIGDTAEVLTQAGPQQTEVVGIARFGEQDGPAGASYVFFTSDAAQAYLTAPGTVDAVKVVADEGVSDEQLVQRIAAVVPDGIEVLTGAQITAEDQDTIRGSMSFMGTFFLVFALIALFVGSFIIYNSFSILVAQRGKEMALLRAIGASRRQVLGSVLLEAAVVGVFASIVGLVAGIGVAIGLKAMLGGMGIEIPTGAVTITPKTIVMAFVAGLGVSIASAVFPARRAAKVPPIAALRDMALDTSASSHTRVIAGVGVSVLGAAAIAVGLAGGGVPTTGLGAALVFVGISVLGPVIAKPMSRFLGAPLPVAKGMAGTLARENAMRNPKRTSATAAALMIGVALVAFITITATSTKASIDKTLDESFSGDLVVSAGAQISGGLSPTLADELRALPELDAVTGFRFTAVEVDGTGSLLGAVEPAALASILDMEVSSGSMATMGTGQIAVSQKVADANGWTVGEPVDVRFGRTGVQPLTVAVVYTDVAMLGDYVTSIPTFEANVADQFDVQVLTSYADGVDPAQARAAVDRVTASNPQAEVMDREEFKASKGAQVDMMVNLIYVMLALAVFIALLGIANTLALSIFDRTRELGLLRAVGMTRRQLKATVRYESVIIALLGTTLGLVIGLGFGWTMVQALSDKGLGTFSVPVGQLGVMTVIAAGAGVGAAVLPARRAARMDVLGAIVTT